MEVDRGPDGAERGPPEGRELQEQGTPSEKAHKPENLFPQERKGAMNSAPKCPGGGLPQKKLTRSGEVFKPCSESSGNAGRRQMGFPEPQNFPWRDARTPVPLVPSSNTFQNCPKPNWLCLPSPPFQRCNPREQVGWRREGGKRWLEVKRERTSL